MTVTNPAEALLTLFATWDAASGAPEDRRKAGPINSPGFWRRQNRAVALLEECERLIDEMAAIDTEMDATVHRADLVPAYQTVFGYQPRWGTGTNKPVGGGAGLRRLGGLFRQHLRTSGRDGSERSTLQTTLEEVREEVDQAGYLSLEARAYLLTLVDRALAIVRDEASTDQAVRAVTHETAGALVTISLLPGVPPEKQGRLREWAGLVAAALITGLSAGAIEAGAHLIGG